MHQIYAHQPQIKVSPDPRRAVPLYRYRRNTSIAFSLDPKDTNPRFTKFSYSIDGIAAYVYPTPEPNTVPLFGLHNDHSDTYKYGLAGDDESDFTFAGVVCYLLPQDSMGGVPFYRLRKEIVHEN